MKQYMDAFKAYDIRWIYGKDIDTRFCYVLGLWLGWYLCQQHWKTASILISSDTRKFNKELIEYFIAGLTNWWIEYIDIVDTYATSQYPYGITSSSAWYYIGQWDRDMTTLFTASHNPAEYTWIKAFDRKASLTPTDMLKEIFIDAYTQWWDKAIPDTKPYTQNKTKVAEKAWSYYDTIKEKRSQLQKNHKFVVDFCHGAAVAFEKWFYEEYGNNHLISMINDYPDGTFPWHESDTSNPENYEQLIQKVQEEQAEFWIMFDGDGDRMWIVSNTGEMIPWDIVYAIIAKQILKNRDDKPTLLYDCMCSKIVGETIEKNRWIGKINKVWRFFINQEMQKIGAIAWWEVSGHYMFWEIGCVESILMAQYYIMKESESYNSFDAMIQEYKKYYKWPIGAIHVQDKEKVMAAIAEKYAQYNPVAIDGISVYTDTYRFNIRPSNTENKVRFTVEADDQKTREDTIESIKSIISSSDSWS